MKLRGAALTRTLPLVAALVLSTLLMGCVDPIAPGATFTGEAGNNTTLGTKGYDTYVVHRGDGHDTIQTNKGNDYLQLHPSEGRPLAEADVHFAREQKDLVVWMGDPADAESDSVRIKKWFETEWPTHRLGLISLAGPDRKTAGSDSTIGWTRAWLTPEVTFLADPTFDKHAAKN